MSSYQLENKLVKNLVDLVVAKNEIINTLDPEIFFDGSEDGGLEDGVTGYEARGIKFFTSNSDDYYAGKYLKGTAKEDYSLAFDEINQIVSKLNDISHAFIFWIFPNNIIPSHKDDDDPTFRTIISLNDPGPDHALIVEGFGTYHLSKYESVGLKAQKIEHSGFNYTKEIWMLLTLCFNDTDENGIFEHNKNI